MNPIKRAMKVLLKKRRERNRSAAAEVVIISFPKSGRTWLRTLIGAALCKRYGLPEERLLETEWLSAQAGILATTLSHDGTSNIEAVHVDRLPRDKGFYRDKKVVLLLRDPRDVATSCYFQASRRRDLYTGPIADFIRDPRYGISKIVTYFNIWQDNRDVPRELCVVSYEQMHEQPREVLRRVLETMGVTGIDDALLDHAVEYADFRNMKKLEQGKHFRKGLMREKNTADPEASKVRKGKVGGHSDYLNAEDLAYCESVMAELGCPLLKTESTAPAARQHEQTGTA